MRILLIGANGLLGRAVRDELASRHDIVGAGRTRGDLKVDITDPRSIEMMYQRLGLVDAVICAAGEVLLGIRSKLMGQIVLVLHGLTRVNEHGSFTLTSGITDRDPVRGFVNASMANAVLAGFVIGAAIEMPRGQRINVVSPGMFAESAEQYSALFPGHVGIPVALVARAYAKSVEGGITGQKIVP